MYKIRLFAFLIGLLCGFGLNAQVTCVPVFPTPDDNVTITFDATQGDAGLLNFTGDIYAHTGVITNLSTSASDWKYVRHAWATVFDDIKLTSIGNHQYTLAINSIKTYYGVPAGETILKMAFVFRNADGSLTGKGPGSTDIFYDVYSATSTNLLIKLVQPSQKKIVSSVGATIAVDGEASIAGNLTLTDNGAVISTGTNTRSLKYTVNVANAGTHSVVFSATAGGQTLSDSFNYVVPVAVKVVDPPVGTPLGASFSADGTAVTLAFQAPRKGSVFVIGNFNNWQLDNQYLMNKSVDGNTWWLKITGLTAGQTYMYQYLVDGAQRYADPLSTLVLDPSNDSYINTASNTVFPNMPAYPTGLTTGFVSVIYPGKPAYTWKATTYQRPQNADLVVYELLVRDFVAKHSYQALIDTINYLKSMNVNAIELMPVSEFDGNDSWGYNPDFHNALDKYYGSPDKFKEFIDLCHQNGIAVIMDVVFNHITGNSPLAQMYWNSAAGKPAADNPWLNVNAPHPYSVFNDFNHESQFTKDYMDVCLKNWLTEYKIDGYRFDLAKGFTQTTSTEATASNYDQSRVNILTRLYNVVQTASPGAYVILEYFVENKEEKTMANLGAMVWGNMVYNYNQCTMGYGDNNLDWMSFKSRGYDNPNVLGYMESHDEERLMFKNEQYGNSNAGYNVKDIPTGLRRNEAAAALFYTIPGPKMLWQFGEMGYDVSINGAGGRVNAKPLHWEYLQDSARKRLYNVTRDLIYLKTHYTPFRKSDHNPSELDGGLVKSLHVNDALFNTTVIGNFDITTATINPNFQHSGWWYEYISGDSLNVAVITNTRTLLPGEYHVYTDKKLPVPPSGYIRTITEVKEAAEYLNSLAVYPNPSSGTSFVGYSLRQSADVQMDVFNLMGQRVYGTSLVFRAEGSYEEGIPADLGVGTYFVRMLVNGVGVTRKFLRE